MPVKAILWDLDGTIADTEELHFDAWRVTMPAYGVDYTHEMFITSFGRNNPEILTELIPDLSPAMIQEISDAKEKAFRDLVNPASVCLLPGVAQWLDSCQAQGLRQAIGSSGPMANIAAVVAALDVGDYFRALLSGFSLPRGKPDPAIFLNCAASVEVAPAECLVIEDSIYGVEAARRAGMACVAVGKLANKELIRAYTASSAGPPCVAIGALSDLSLKDVTASI
jgi:beta-phosphoglucomutase